MRLVEEPSSHRTLGAPATVELSSAQLAARDATDATRNADRSRRRVRRAISACGAPFTWTKAGVELEIGFRDFEYLARFSPSRQRWKFVGTIGFVTRSDAK
jgi:hypothetical protein